MGDLQAQEDEAMMRLALHLAAQQTGKTGANPAVGCVIAVNGEVVGQGATADLGRPHAEALALRHAGDKAVGSTVYVTLEPCAHVSLRGPDCANSLIDARIARLVCCSEDPDPRTSGRGFEKLRLANIKVEIGLLATEGKEQIATFASKFS